jgi:cytoskeletal protein CcmA (bactofilin family)
MFKRTTATKNSSTDFSPVPIAGNGKILSVIGKGSTFKGEIVCEGGARIDGSFEGTLLVKGPLVIGETARIVADINADAVSVAGSVKGNITAKKVDIMRTGRIYGDLITGSFTTEEGGFLRGQVRMTDGSAQAEEELPVFTGRPVPVSS